MLTLQMREVLKGDYLDAPYNTSTYMSLVRTYSNDLTYH